MYACFYVYMYVCSVVCMYNLRIVVVNIILI